MPHETVQLFAGRGTPPGRPTGLRAVIRKLQHPEQIVGIVQIERVLWRGRQRDVGRSGAGGRRQVLRQQAVDLGPQGSGRVLGMVRNAFNRDNVIRLDLGEGNCYRGFHLGPPAALDPQVSDIGRHRSGLEFPCGGGHDVRGGAMPDDQAHVPCGKAVAGLAQSVQHEAVMPPVGLRERSQGKHGRDRQAVLVARKDGRIQRGIVLGPLGLLHPVQDRPALRSERHGGEGIGGGFGHGESSPSYRVHGRDTIPSAEPPCRNRTGENLGGEKRIGGEGAHLA